MGERAAYAFDRVADRYDATRGGPARGARMARQVETWLMPGPVLEVGVGTGLVTAALRERGHPAVGLDLSPEMLAIATERLGPGLVARGDARALPVAGNAVSTVLFVYALHVIGDIDQALAEAARVLCDGGRVVALHAEAFEESNDVTEAMAPLDPLRRARVEVAAQIEAGAQAAGLVPVWLGATEAMRSSSTPRKMLDSLTGRLWSYLWDLDEAAWQNRVQPVIEALSALPEPDQPREFVARHRISVFAADSGLRQSAGRAFADRLLATTPPGGRVLAAACGAGGVADLPAYAARAAGRTVHCARLTELSTLDTPYDAVLCVDAMAHLAEAEWPAALGALRNALKPHGYAYLTVPEVTQQVLGWLAEARFAMVAEQAGEGGSHVLLRRT